MNTSVLFRTTFDLPNDCENPSITVSVHADNVATVLLNENEIGTQPDIEDVINFQNPPELFESNDLSFFLIGTNTIDFLVQNFGDPGVELSGYCSVSSKAIL